ncbi:MAG: cytochrome C biogenesis protein [Caldisericia bacterium]|nr:cytochrome C biogenesis protein [Caldisericia bacterium]
MSTFFATLSKAIVISQGVALLVSFVWGVLSVVLSPCHLATIPLMIGYISEYSENSVKKAFQISLLFALGMLASISVIGVVTASLGRIVGDLGNFSNYFMAAVFMLIGLQLLDVIVIEWNSPKMKKKSNEFSLWNAFFLGILFGVGLGPCTFAYMAPMLGIVFQEASANLIFSIAMILSFAIGHSLVIVFAGTFSEVVQGYLKWTQDSNAIVILRKICGVLVFIAGLYFLFK